MNKEEKIKPNLILTKIMQLQGKKEISSVGGKNTFSVIVDNKYE